MNKKSLILWVLLGMLLAFSATANAQEVQVKRAEKIVTVGSKQFYMHHVKEGETLYAIAKAYHVTQAQIEECNPDVKDGNLRAGSVLGIPAVAFEEESTPEVPVASTPRVVEKQTSQVVTVGGKSFYMHHVKEGETVYGISKAYEVTEQELLELNPELSEGLKAGAVVGIPVPKTEQKPKTEPKVEPKQEPKVEPKQEPKIEPKQEPKVDPKEEPKEEPKVEPKEEPKIEPKVEPQVEPEEEPEVEIVRMKAPVFDEDDEFGDGYVIHTVKEAEKTKTLIKRWDITEEEFRMVNPSVGSRVFVGQKVLIPLKNAPAKQETVIHYDLEEPEEEEIPVEEPVVEQVENEEDMLPWEKLLYAKETPFDCYATLSNADRSYHVALLVPLYLSEIDKLDASRDRVEKSKKSRSLKFLQFYEGFMMAADSLTKHHGLRLELTVLDVTENTPGAETAVNKLRDEDVDLIIGPFFSKSFAVVQEFAAERNIFIVNPLSERESVVLDAPNVLKLKPGTEAMVSQLADLIKIKYPKSKVTLLTPTTVKDSVTVDAIERALNAVVEPEVQLSNAEMLELITKESQRRKMGKRVLSNLEVEGQIFSTKSLSDRPDEVTVFENQFHRITYSDADLKTFKQELSAARDNVLVAYGDNVVFATKVLNTINRSAKKYPITLIGLPQWSELDNLLVPNLLNMNAIYFEDHFVDYNDSLVMQFVDDFRAKYESEPMEYAFEGFDVGWYFLNALMQFGSNSVDCLPYYHLPLLSTRYYFNKCKTNNGLENRYWNIYQYDNRAIELKPVLIYEDEEE